MRIIRGLPLLRLLCYFNRIGMAIAVIKSDKESSIIYYRNGTLMLVPPIFHFGYEILGTLDLLLFNIYSIGDVKGSSDTP
ncbi:unnamed protein product [Paramecium octaurelia]|uniref:Uncharacterized protein n=1 Tax=Paramecium octaurelia TaxID=43137 RepID=A0A8S1TNV9_PAROT|nr:unnamed protein product [Paramecium octaurelia]